jgi:diaminohydroxyphosphoribosylaminopyrimidine deaminase/5-amino-6-(5-phosphoribosylamino)uracil reductase
MFKEMRSPCESLMARAIEIAEKGVGFVSPNPLVGAVIVKNGKRIGEGYHEAFGQNHAEPNAIADAERNGFSVDNSEMYVTLEPCAHHGKTPPCTDIILRKKIAKVYIAISDPNKIASGGIEKLQNAGVEIQTGLLESEAKKQNRFFFFGIHNKRPFFVGKIAVDANGYGAKKKGEQTQISGKKAQEFTHKLRMRCDAIVIGAETAIIDNPLLSVRFGEKRRDPLRILIDPNLRIPSRAKVFRNEHFLRIVSTTTPRSGDTKNPFMNNNIVQIENSKESGIDLKKLSNMLFQRGIRSVLVEGGVKTLESFANADLLDEMIVIKSNRKIGQKGAPYFPMELLQNWNRTGLEKHGEDQVITYTK